MKTTTNGVTRRLHEAGVQVGRAGEVTVSRGRDDEHVRVVPRPGAGELLTYVEDILRLNGYTVELGISGFYINVTKGTWP